MSIRFACPSCGKKYKVDQSQAGRKSKCRKCGHRLQVPRPEGSGTAHAAQPNPAAEDAELNQENYRLVDLPEDKLEKEKQERSKSKHAVFFEDDG